MESEDAQLQKMLMQATLLANLDALRVYMPEVYEEFKSYQAEGAGVALDSKNNINLFNGDKFVYDDPVLFAKKQVALFIKKPPMFTYRLSHKNDEDIAFEHPTALKSLTAKRKAEVLETVRRPIDDERIDFICMIGAGLGYQIEELFNKKSVVNFLLCEPSKDTFYAMLHCIEIRGILEKCIQLGGRFSVRIGGSSAGIVNAVSSFLHEQGHFNLSRFFVYRHYLSDTTEDTLKLFHQIGHRWGSGWGFMEDEIIGITHTLSNIQAGFKVCKKITFFENKLATRPVFIAGNGPSLDESIEYLKNNQDRVIIVSAGTSLKALLKNDIKPDIHFEMERTLGTIPYIEAIERQQKNSSTKLSDIQVIALNTVASQVLNKFKNPLLITKRYDAGGQLIQKADKLERHVAPEYSNPTVSNTALATLLSLGFKNIYLVGTDFGYLCESYHHSKDSIYYDDDYFAKDRVKKQNIDKYQRVKGNFADSVYTTDIFDSSRGHIELALQTQLEKYNQFDTKVYNCSNGAFIRFTEPKRISELPQFKSFTDKADALEVLFTEAFENKQFTRKKLDKAISSSFNEVKVILDQLMQFTNKEMQSREELSEAFHLQNALLVKLQQRPEYQVTYWIIQGSFRYFQTNIMSNTYYYDDLSARNKFINYCLSVFRKHMKQRYVELLHAYNKPSKV